jgi:hypothetical protein
MTIYEIDRAPPKVGERMLLYKKGSRLFWSGGKHPIARATFLGYDSISNRPLWGDVDFWDEPTHFEGMSRRYEGKCYNQPERLNPEAPKGDAIV